MMQKNQQQQFEYGSAEEYLGVVRRMILKRWWIMVLFVVAVKATSTSVPGPPAPWQEKHRVSSGQVLRSTRPPEE